MIEKIPSIFKNFYFLTTLLFGVWILFIDSNSIFSQIQLREQLTSLKAKKEYYQKKIEEVKVERKELMSNNKLLEKFARENYFMKKEGEDIYVLIDKKD